MFKDLPLIQHITLEFNPITELKSESFSNLPKLEYLSLSFCHIENIEEGTAYVNF